jgi:hypothetical protein
LQAVLLHLYCPGKRPADQCETWEALAFMGHLSWLEVRHRPGPGAVDNARHLNMYWDGPGDLLTVEQDIVPTLGLVEELVYCPEPFCAFDFLLGCGVPWSQVPGGTGIGLAKISERARKAVTATPPVPQVPWHDLAAALWERLGPAHVHRPLVKHNHRD